MEYLSKILVQIDDQTVAFGGAILAQGEQVPTTIVGLLSAVVMAVLAGVGWAGMRMLGAGGVLEQHSKALTANAEAVKSVSDMVKNHDNSTKIHSEACTKAGITVEQLHAAAIEACDGLEEVCRENKIDIGTRIGRVREALRS
jgi:hypothetical protein